VGLVLQDRAVPNEAGFARCFIYQSSRLNTHDTDYYHHLLESHQTPLLGKDVAYSHLSSSSKWIAIAPLQTEIKRDRQ
jgi:hypothetical protein